MSGTIISGWRKLRENDAFSLLLRPRALLNYARWKREVRVRPTAMSSTPPGVEIELTNRCNLACIQCLRSRGLKPYELGDIAFGDFQRVLAQFPWTTNLCLNGFGEPLLHERFFDVVAWSRRALPGAKIVIYSNGMLLDDAVARRLPGSGLTELNVSIDAALPSTYQRVRRGGELERVHEGIRRLLRAREEARSRFPLVGVNYVLLNENEGELVRFVEQAGELGVDFINCISYATYDWGFRNQRSPDSYRQELAAARRRIDELGIRCRTFPETDLAWADPARPFDCSFFWGGSVRVTWDGSLTLGCCTPFRETYSYGNLMTTPFAQLWNGPRMRANREATRERRPPDPVCASCDRMCKSFFEGRPGRLPTVA
jgi:MoaA/NifB/PqqE/SkfB family radical SAM enzyme